MTLLLNSQRKFRSVRLCDSRQGYLPPSRSARFSVCTTAVGKKHRMLACLTGQRIAKDAANKRAELNVAARDAIQELGPDAVLNMTHPVRQRLS